MTKTASQKARARSARSSKNAAPQQLKKNRNARSAAEKRWHFGVDKFNAGPLGISGFSMGSGDRPKRSGRSLGRRGDSQECTLFSRREVVGIVSGSTGFVSTQSRVQPGEDAIFPWLSQIAPLYEKYRFRKLHFVFENFGSGYAAANQSGRVVMAFDYNVLSANLATYADACMKDPHVSFTPYESATLAIDTSLLGHYYTRGDNYPAGGDPKSYDAGMLYMVTDGTPSTATIGTLYVDYEIEMYAPQLSEIQEPKTVYTIAQRDVDLGSLPTWVTTVEGNLPFDATPTPLNGGLEIPYAGGVFTLPAGNYRIAISITFTNTASALYTTKLSHRINGGASNPVAATNSASAHAEQSLSWVGFLSVSAGTTFEPRITLTFTGGVNQLFPLSNINFQIM